MEELELLGRKWKELSNYKFLKVECDFWHTLNNLHRQQTDKLFPNIKILPILMKPHIFDCKQFATTVYCLYQIVFEAALRTYNFGNVLNTTKNSK